MKEEFSGIMLILLLTGMLALAFRIPLAEGLEPPMTEWSNTYGGTHNDEAYSLVQTNDGGYAIAGHTKSFGGGGMDAWLVKTDSSGTHEWNHTYGGTNDDLVQSMVQTADGGYAMAGYTSSSGAGARDFWLVKTDQFGNLQWDHTYGGTNDDEVWWGLVQTGDEGYLMVGHTRSRGAGGADFWLVKTDSSGNHEWDKTYGGTSDDWAASVTQTSDGGFATVGFTESFAAGGRDVWLVKTDSAGNHEWNKTYGGAAWDEGFSVIQKHDGGYAIAGHTRSFGASGWDWLLIITDSSGNLLQPPIIYGGPSDDYAHCIRQTSDGGYVIGGSMAVSPVGGDFDGWLVKTDASGNHEWDQLYSGIRRDALYYVVKTWDGGYALAGYTGLSTQAETGHADFWLIKLAPQEIPATIDIDPDTLNMKSNGQWITAYITLPEGYSVEDIVLEKVHLNGISAVWSDIQNGVYMAKFDRALVQTSLTNEPDYETAPKFYDITLTVTGELTNGALFQGTDTIIVLKK